MALVTCMRSRLVHRVGDTRVFLASAERHTLLMRYGHGRETASGPIDRRSPDQPVAAALSPGLRRTQKVNIMMVLRADRARPAEAISSRHLVLVKTQLGTVYTHQEFKTRSLTPIPDLLRLPLIH